MTKKIRVTVVKSEHVTYHEVFTGLTFADLKIRIGKYLMSLDLGGVESITMTLE